MIILYCTVPIYNAWVWCEIQEGYATFSLFHINVGQTVKHLAYE